jgi:peptidoglycan/xylan/chitin deacetylase (PgdA/CDA1 family)
MAEPLLFSLQIDCESTQRSVRNPDLGKRALDGLGEILAETSTKGTFLVIPGDIEVHASIYRDLKSGGHEVGLHIHGAEQGAGEFLGDQSPVIQRRVIAEGLDRFAQAMGERPFAFCPGYHSANDFTFGLLEELGFTHGSVTSPTRNLPQLASVWGGSSLDPHYPHRFNRVLEGDVDFVDLPVTIDPDSRLWGGGQPLDLRVEQVDAKNHFYTVDKAVRRQVAQKTPLRQIHALTHSIFDFSDRRNFRRETYVGIVSAARQIAERENLGFQGATLASVAAAYRERMPIAKAGGKELMLDTRGRSFNRS